MDLHCVVRDRFILVYFLLDTMWETYKLKLLEISEHHLDSGKHLWHIFNLLFHEFLPI